MEVVKQLDGMIIRGQQVVAKQLPCVFGEALTVLNAALETYQPQLTIAVGQAGGRVDTVERVAINVDDARIPDNKGQQPIDEPIVADGPAACFSTLPIKAIVGALRQQDPCLGVANRGHLRLQSRDVWFAASAAGKAAEGWFYPFLIYLNRRRPIRGRRVCRSRRTRGAGMAIAVALEQDDDVKIGGGATHQQKDETMPEGPEIRRAADTWRRLSKANH